MNTRWACAFGVLVLIAAAVASGWEPRRPPEVAVPGFKPSIHGFRFVNSFSGSSLPKALTALVGNVGPSRFGLCGGMSSAAADFFLAKTPVAGTARIPMSGTPLYEYIYGRQVDSLGAGFAMVPRFIQWMQAPDDGPAGTAQLTMLSLPELLKPIDAGQPVVVGLVYVKAGQGVLWSNHQVLAHGYSRRAGGLSLFIYDPNYPGNDRVTIEFRPVVCGTIPGPDGANWPLGGLRCQQRIGADDNPEHDRTKVVHGAFAMPYAPRLPPASLSQ